MQQQQQDTLDKKRAFNFLLAIALAHQRTTTLPLRTRYGTEGLGMPAVWAFVLICLWGGFSRDPFFCYYLVFWFCSLACRRIESLWLRYKGARLHSYYDGYPRVALWVPFLRSEFIAKLVVEPVIVFGAGYGVGLLSENNGTPPGLANFLMYGALTLPFVEGVKEMLWRRRLQSLRDARIEQEHLAARAREEMGE